MLPLITTTAFSAVMTGVLTSKWNIAWELLVGSNAVMAIGCGISSMTSTSPAIQGIGYLYQVVLGTGFGITMASSMIVARSEVLVKDNGTCSPTCNPCPPISHQPMNVKFVLCSGPSPGKNKDPKLTLYFPE
jgi:hypothetical protein